MDGMSLGASGVSFAAGAFMWWRGDFLFSDPELVRWIRRAYIGLFCVAGVAFGIRGVSEPAYGRAGPGQPPAAIVDPPAPIQAPPPVTVTPAPISSAPPQAGGITGRVVDRDRSVPIPAAQILLGSGAAQTDPQGAFRLAVPQDPLPQEFLRVRHGDYVNRFLTYAQFQRHGGSVMMAPKMRVIVVEFDGTRHGQPLAPYARDVRRILEDRLVGSHICLTLAEDKRDEVVQKLYAYQQDRALYDKATLAKVGNFYGATHGVFGSATRRGDVVMLECQLIDLSTARLAQSATLSVRVDQARLDATFPAAVDALADRLLARFAELAILWPESGTRCSRQIVVSGSTVGLPASWTVWLTLVPSGNSRHYPQRPVTAEEDGRWLAPEVYVGSEQAGDRGHPFELFAILTDAQASNAFQEYLSSGRDDGVDLLTLTGQHRILDHISLTREL
jgi:hypothetical protein